MARKRHTPDEIVAKLRQVDVLVGQGQAVAEAIRARHARIEAALDQADAFWT